MGVPLGFSTALIGSNGAGKTTLLDILAGITRSTGGSVRYFDANDDIESSAVRNAIGYCAANNFFPGGWNAKYIAASMSLAFDNFDRKKFEQLCKAFKLETEHDKKPRPLIRLSDGNQMRMSLAATFARDTRLLILDEPASSLDPVMRDNLCDRFRQYINEGEGKRSIFFSTHNIADMEYATDYAIFMADGKIIEQGFVEALKEKYRMIHGDAAQAAQASPRMFTCHRNSTMFEGIALAEQAPYLSQMDAAVEVPTLQQLSVGILRKAEEEDV